MICYNMLFIGYELKNYKNIYLWEKGKMNHERSVSSLS